MLLLSFLQRANGETPRTACLPTHPLINLSHAFAQRKILLHKSRQIRKTNDSNLKTLARSTTWKGGVMKALTQISRMIQWLRIAFHTKLRDDVDRHPTPTGEEYETAAAAIRSEAIDRALQEEATTLRRETKLVLFGDRKSGKELIMQQIKVLYGDGYYSTDERQKCRYAMRSTVRLLIHSIINLLKDTGIHLPSELNQHFAVLLHEVETVDIEILTLEAVSAIEQIWSCPEFSRLYIRNFEIEFPLYAPYFVQEASRIAAQDYMPSEADIIRLSSVHGQYQRAAFQLG